MTSSESEVKEGVVLLSRRLESGRSWTLQIEIECIEVELTPKTVRMDERRLLWPSM